MELKIFVEVYTFHGCLFDEIHISAVPFVNYFRQILNWNRHFQAYKVCLVFLIALEILI